MPTVVDRREIGPFRVPPVDEMPSSIWRDATTGDVSYIPYLHFLPEEAYNELHAERVVDPKSKEAKRAAKKEAKNEAKRLEAECPKCGATPVEWHDYWKLGFDCKACEFTWYPDPYMLKGYV